MKTVSVKAATANKTMVRGVTVKTAVVKTVAVVFTFALALTGFVARAEDPQLVTGVFHTGYVPDGFDSNDRVQVVAEGYFSNTCYRTAGYESKVDVNKKVIEVASRAYKYKGMCLQMIVPYSQVINVGLLEAGVYTVKDKNHGTLGSLKVKLSTSGGPDDYLYAPISQAAVESDASGHYVAVSGKFTNSCVEFKDLRAEIQKNVILVLPISEMADRSDCVAGSFPFSKTVKLGNGLTPGRYLLHVRSLNGNAINNLVDIEE